MLVHYENGDYYKGQLRQGQRNGQGFSCESSYTYNGEWVNDLKHGNGTLCSEQNDSSTLSIKMHHDYYLYDGEWYMGKKQGLGQEVTCHGKYNGEWLNDKRHGYGSSMPSVTHLKNARNFS